MRKIAPNSMRPDDCIVVVDQVRCTTSWPGWLAVCLFVFLSPLPETTTGAQRQGYLQPPPVGSWATRLRDVRAQRMPRKTRCVGHAAPVGVRGEARLLQILYSAKPASIWSWLVGSRIPCFRCGSMYLPTPHRVRGYAQARSLFYACVRACVRGQPVPDTCVFQIAERWGAFPLCGPWSWSGT